MDADRGSLGYKPNDWLQVRMILLDEKDVIAVTWQCSRIGAREIKIHPLGQLRFCRARSPCLRSSTARSYQNKVMNTNQPGQLSPPK